MVELLKKYLILSAAFLVCLAGDIAAQDEPAYGDYAPADTVFEKISLGTDGVTALDTAGRFWYYDFTFETFIVGDPDEGPIEDGGYEKPGFGVDIPPVEERCTEERVIKPFVKSALIGLDEYVDGDIVAYGRVTIKGWVKGNVRSIDKRVLVTETGRVDGDIQAPEIVVKEGGIVLGEQIMSETPLQGLEGIIDRYSYDGMIVVLSFTAVFLFFGFLVTTLMPKQMQNFNECLIRDKIKCYLLGFFFVLMMPVIILLMALTIVAAVLIPLLPLVYFFAIVLGVISFGNFIGGLITIRFLQSRRSLLLQSSLGIVALMLLWLVTAILLGSSQPVSEGFGIFLLVVSICVSSYPLFTGVGAAVLTRFGFKQYVSWKLQKQRTPGGPAPTPAPPPIPKAPPEPSPRSFPNDSDET
ncbi:MAG: polymer-forming cytoskeletal protein [Candidatus Zixiibacteriota bacterium]